MLDPAATAKINDLLQSATADPYKGLPRVVVMAATGKDGLVFSGSAGCVHVPDDPKELAKAELVSEDSIFELHSCTKLVSVICALKPLRYDILHHQEGSGGSVSSSFAARCNRFARQCEELDPGTCRLEAV